MDPSETPPRKDVVGLGFRSEIMNDTLSSIERGEVECLELIAEEHFHASDSKLKALKHLARLVPMSVHGVALGLGSVHPVQVHRMDNLARLCDAVQPAFWSEHLALVRHGNVEIGHLTAPPRSSAVVHGVSENVARIARHVGAKPLLENIATLMNPPCSEMDEPSWLNAILNGTDSRMLLDLHNLYANAVNMKSDPFGALSSLPLERVSQIHLAGGVDIASPGGGVRVLDTHSHGVPRVIFDMLEVVAAQTSQPLTVIIERDGRYPEFSVLANEMRQAKLALKRGRATRDARLAEA